MNEAARDESTAIAVEDLSVFIKSRPLLEKASFAVPKGEVALLVGLSGSGKSVTLRLLLGLSDPALTITGEVELLGRPATEVASKCAGIVFQEFGLLDEWSIRENIRFGVDHRREKADDPKSITTDLLTELGLDGDTRVAAASSGMKQRCALARTLAFDPDIVLYDEPTSGLDPAMSARIAERIRAANDQHGKTSLVVTHDLGALTGIADRIILLDPAARNFRQVAPEDIDSVLHELQNTRMAEGDNAASGPGLGARATGFFAASGRVFEAGVATLGAMVPAWPRARWGARYLWYYLRLSTVGSAIVYMALSGFILGLIVTWFTFSFLPFKSYTEPILIDRVVSGIGYALYRILTPGLVSLLIAARSGAAIASDIGNRVYGRQIDAMRSLGIAPWRYLLGNALWAHILGAPILFGVAFLCARYASLGVFVTIHPEQSTWFWDREFERFLTGEGALLKGTWWAIGKTVLAAWGTAAIAYFQGMRPKASSRDVSGAVTAAIIWSTIWVLLVQTVCALMEFEPI